MNGLVKLSSLMVVSWSPRPDAGHLGLMQATKVCLCSISKIPKLEMKDEEKGKISSVLARI